MKYPDDEFKPSKSERLSLDRRERKREGKRLWHKERHKKIRESRTSENLVNRMNGEPWDRRHARRLAFNVAMLSEVEKWAGSLRIKFIVHKDGKKWLMFLGNHRAAYWPETARLEIDDAVHHIHDYRRVVEMIESEWGLGEGNPRGKGFEGGGVEL